MALMGRYIFRQTAVALLMILITLTLIVWVTTALRELKILTSHGQTFFIFLKITLLTLPNLIVIVAPVALLISALHTLNRLSGDSEIIVFSAAGAPIWRVMTPYIVLALIVAVAVACVNFYFMPKSMRLLRDYLIQVRTDLISQVLQPGNFTSAEKGLTFHIRDKGANGDLLGLMVHDERNTAQAMTYLADRGEIIKREGRSFLIMYGGHVHRHNTDENEVHIISFDSYLFDISQLGPQDGERDYKPKERYITELISPDTDDEYYEQNEGKFRAELHDRLASPLYPILFVLIAVVHLGYPRTTRQGRLQSVFLAFSAAAFLRIAGLAATNALAKKASAVFFVYGIPVAGIAAALLLAYFNLKPGLPSLSIKLPLKLRLPGRAGA